MPGATVADIVVETIMRQEGRQQRAHEVFEWTVTRGAPRPAARQIDAAHVVIVPWGVVRQAAGRRAQLGWGGGEEG